MLDITLVAIGKIKDKNIESIFWDYVKRLKPYVRLKIVELPSVAFSKMNKTRAKELEGQEIKNFLELSSKKQGQQKVYLLAERGKLFSSQELAVDLEKESSLILIVGGALGFSEDMYKSYPQISLSPLTFTHELARLVLIEQIYRSATIINKKEYHY